MIPDDCRTSNVVGMTRACADSGWADATLRGMLADALEEAGYRHELTLTRLRDGGYFDREPFDDLLRGIPAALSGYDWRNVFAYAGEPDTGGDGSASIKAAEPGTEIDLSPFSRADVAELLGTSEGENDEQNWLAYGRLRDGRYFFITAGCDYTGWG